MSKSSDSNSRFEPAAGTGGTGSDLDVGNGESGLPIHPPGSKRVKPKHVEFKQASKQATSKQAKSGNSRTNEGSDSQLPSLEPQRRSSKPQTNSSQPKENRSTSSPQSAAADFSTFAAEPERIDRKAFAKAIGLNPVHLNDEDLETESITETIHRIRHPLSSFFVSLFSHIALLVGLMLFVFAAERPIPRISVLATFDANPVPENPADVDTETVKIEIPDDSQSPIDMQHEDVSTDVETEIADNPEDIINAIAESNNPIVSENDAPAKIKNTMPTGGGLEGREANARSQMAASRGGSLDSEMAVENGLYWIISHQQKDGGWRFFHHEGECDGRCPNQGLRESSTAATGLALMSLMGAGYTHEKGPYKEQVARGLEYLLKRMRYTPHGGILGEGEQRMYSQAIATIALAEAFTMTSDTNLMDPVDAARRFIVNAQHTNGGWRYEPAQPGDLSVTGWQIMALKSCELAGFPTDPEVWRKAEGFVNSLSSSSGQYGYQHPDRGTPTTTAVGLLSQMYLGMHKEHGNLELGCQFLDDRGPSKSDVYFNYYATQVMHHQQADAWKSWNHQMRDYLIKTQEKRDGHVAGSWYFEDQHGRVGGRLYTTAMAVMILEVYYRFMPLYEEKAIGSAPFGAGVEAGKQVDQRMLR